MTDVDPPRTAGQRPTFEAPWQARAFGVAVAYCEEQGHDFAEFQDRLIERLDAVEDDAMNADVEGVYYERWLASLEDFLVEEGVLDADEVDARQAEFAEGERDASEFLVER